MGLSVVPRMLEMRTLVEGCEIMGERIVVWRDGLRVATGRCSSGSLWLGLANSRVTHTPIPFPTS